MIKRGVRDVGRFGVVGDDRGATEHVSFSDPNCARFAEGAAILDLQVYDDRFTHAVAAAKSSRRPDGWGRAWHFLEQARVRSANLLDYDSLFTELTLSVVNKIRSLEMKKNLRAQPLDAQTHLPPPHPDDVDVDLRDLVCERLLLGVRLSDAEMTRIRENGYTAYFMKLGKSSRSLGGRSFKKLRAADRLDLTTEYVLFHRFRDRLDPDIRRRIAAILAESVTHPHARWESRSQG